MGWWPLSGSRRAGADKPLDAPCSNDGGGSGSVSDGGGARSDAPQASSSSRLAANDSAAASASIVAAVAAAAEGAGPPAATAATVAADRKPPIELVEVEPVHVVAASMGVLSLGKAQQACMSARAWADGSMLVVWISHMKPAARSQPRGFSHKKPAAWIQLHGSSCSCMEPAAGSQLRACSMQFVQCKLQRDEESMQLRLHALLLTSGCGAWRPVRMLVPGGNGLCMASCAHASAWRQWPMHVTLGLSGANALHTRMLYTAHTHAVHAVYTQRHGIAATARRANEQSCSA
eukprot:359699-Chlamydomonas_euryale.AAC.5